MALFGGFALKASYATLANIAIQPKPPVVAAPVITTPVVAKAIAAAPIAKAIIAKAVIEPQPSPIASLAKKVVAADLFAHTAETVKVKFQFSRFNYQLVKDRLFLSPDTRYNDELPRASTKFTPFEELSGIASTRPEILSVSEFKPIFTGNSGGFTSAGEFLDAQVKLMNLRHEAVVSLINDLKKNPDVANQLDQIEGDFVAHMKNLKSRTDFLVSLQKYIDSIVKLLDLRDSGSKVDYADTLQTFFSSVFSNITTAQNGLPSSTYADLLSQHGFNKSKVSGFSSTKTFLQLLYEARKILRSGTDELVGTDPSLASRDADAAALNKRTYRDPHADLGRMRMLTYSDVSVRNVHESDTRLNSLLSELETDFRSHDKVFTGASEEISYTLKVKTVAREAAYSYSLSNTATVSMLGDYGYPVSTDVGNQQLFDAVYGQLGSRITDNRNNSNVNSVASIASRIDGDKAVLTYEVDYLEDDQGSVFTPGASYYVASTLKPTGASAFAIDRASELVTRMTPIINHYVDFVGRFNLLPKVSNTLYNQLASSNFVFDPSVMTNALYSLFVDDSSGYIKADCSGNPIVDLMAEAATHPALRANLLMYVSTVTNVSGDGLEDAVAARQLAGQDLRADAQKRAADAENQNAKVGPTVDKLIANCVTYYKQITGDNANATKVENALKNFNEQGPLARALAFVKGATDVVASVTTGGYTRYSRLSNVQMTGLFLQLVLDSARRYAHNPTRVNNALNINTNFRAAAKSPLSIAARQVITSPVLSRIAVQKPLATLALATPLQKAALGISMFVSKAPLKQAVLARLEREENLTMRTVLAPLYAMHTVQSNLKAFILYLQKPESTAAINDVLSIVGDNKLVELLGDKGQIRILSDTINTVLDKITITDDRQSTTDLTDVVSLTRSGDPSDDLRIFDDSFVTSKTLNLLKAALADARYNPERGTNVRVISFGLPHGFSTHLRNKFKLTTFAEQAKAKLKQNDVVIADVYKVDVRYPDLIFKPISKVIELSRFVVRDENKFKAMQVGAPLTAVLDAVPTVDYSDFSASTGDPTQDSSYSFMEPKDREALRRNTVMSYLLELYYRLLTGIPLSERELYMNDPDDTDRPAPYVTRAILQNVAENVYKVPVDTSNFKMNLSSIVKRKAISYFDVVAPKTSRPVTNTAIFAPIKRLLIDSLTPRVATHSATVAPAAKDAGTKKTVYMDKEVAAKYVMTPKMFERVFFVDVDPDDFEIDHDETFKNPIGRASFAQLQHAGEVEVVTETMNNVSRDAYYLKDHRLEKQMTFEKYFVVVRSYSPITTRTR